MGWGRSRDGGVRLTVDCPRCAGPLAADDVSCGRCGLELQAAPVVPAPTQTAYPTAGQTPGQTAGRSELPEVPAVPDSSEVHEVAERPEPTAVAEFVPAEVGGRTVSRASLGGVMPSFCVNCGRPLTPGHRFCTGCGSAITPLETSRPMAAEPGFAAEPVHDGVAVQATESVFAPAPAPAFTVEPVPAAPAATPAVTPALPPMAAAATPAPMAPAQAAPLPGPAGPVEPGQPLWLAAQNAGQIPGGQAAALPSLGALPAHLQGALILGAQVLGLILAFGAAMSLLGVVTMAALADAGWGFGTSIGAFFAGIPHMAGLILFGDLTMGSTLLGESGMSMSGLTPIWVLALLLSIIVRLARRRPRQSAVGPVLVESAIATAVAVGVLTLIISLFPVTAGEGFAEAFLKVGAVRVFFLGGLALFLALALPRLGPVLSAFPVFQSPLIAPVGRALTLVRDHFLLCYAVAFVALTITALIEGPFKLAVAMVIVMGPLATISFVQLPALMLGVPMTTSANATAEGLANFLKSASSEGSSSVAASHNNGLFSSGAPTWLIILSLLASVLIIVILGLRWGLAQPVGWHSVWGTAWFLPVVFAIAWGVITWLASITVSGSLSSMIPILGGSSGGMTVRLAAYAFLVMAVVGLAVEAVARVLAPVIAVSSPGLVRLLRVAPSTPRMTSAGPTAPPSSIP
ncbi:MAG TPA: zinc ribbon domain-containing protein [Phycicoccus sp.]|nr:zinc ribbon domain-containing protein [Phycicoccus sp.]